MIRARPPRPRRPSAARPAPTTGVLGGGHGGPQARGLLLDGRPAAHRDRRLGRRRQVDADRPAAAGLQAAARRPVEPRPTSPTSPTACAPSASRASRSTSPTASSPPPARSFILADTPGHVRYTRNMVTGASTADLALVLVDARKGLVEQSRRHAYLSALLGIRHLVACVNKMDLVDLDEERFRRDRGATFARARRARWGSPTCAAIPISALDGDNVVDAARSATPWYDGPPLLEQLETRRGRARPQPRRRPLPRPVDGARARTTAATPASVAGGVLGAGRRGRRAAPGRAHADRAHRHRRRAGRAGVPADGRSTLRARRRARRRPRRHGRRARRRAGGGARARRRPSAGWSRSPPARARATCSSTPRAGCGRRIEAVDARVDVEHAGEPRRRLASSRSTTSAGAAAHQRAGARRRLRRATGRPAPSS